VEVQILELKVRNRLSESGQVNTVDPVVVLVGLRQDQVEVTANGPWTWTLVPDGFRLFQE
jgi:hypothetical protein